MTKNKKRDTRDQGPVAHPFNYTASALKNIAGALPRFANQDRRRDLEPFLKTWAGWYAQSLSQTKEPGAKDIRARLKRIHEKAKGLSEAINNLDDRTRWHLNWSAEPDEKARFPIGGGKRVNHAVNWVSRLSDWAGKELPPFKKGRTLKTEIRQAVCELAEIYHYLTGMKPTRRVADVINKEYGPFRDFIIAVLNPIHADAVSAPDDAIKYAIAHMGKRGWKTGIVKSIIKSMT